MWSYVGVILISFLISGMWAKYIAATANEKAESAAVYDLLLMLASSGIYQIWAIRHNSFTLLVVGDVAAALGTYTFIRATKSLRSKKRSKKQSWGVKILSKVLGE